jgi:DNA sulfur modification protein DndB
MSKAPEDNSLTPELQGMFDTVLATCFSQYYKDRCYLGLSFEQGKRRMIQINIPAHDLPTLLQSKPSLNNDPDSGKNRPEVHGHVEEVKQYLLKRINSDKPWILGTLTANVDPSEIQLIELGRGICFVVIPPKVKLDITDGQHRKRAIHELIESADGNLIADNYFPVTLVLELDDRQCQTDFRDMAQTRALDKSLLISFGEFEGRVGIVKNLQEKVPMFYKKTEKIKGTPSSKHKLIYTTNYIAKLVSCAFTNTLDSDLEDFNVEEASKCLVSCLNQFFSECSQTRQIFETQHDDLTIEQISRFKEECILGRSVGLEILGRLLYCIYESQEGQFDAYKVSQIAQLDWSVSSDLWRDNIVKVDPLSGDTTKKYKISAGMATVKIAVNQAKIKLGLIIPKSNLELNFDEV